MTSVDIPPFAQLWWLAFHVIFILCLWMYALQYQILLRKNNGLPWFVSVYSKIRLCIFATILFNYLLLIKLLRGHNPGQTLFVLTPRQAECQCLMFYFLKEVISKDVIVQHVEANHLHSTLAEARSTVHDFNSQLKLQDTWIFTGRNYICYSWAPLTCSILMTMYIFSL